MHDALQNIVDAADGYNMDVNIKKVLSGMGFAQDTLAKEHCSALRRRVRRGCVWQKLLAGKSPDVLILDEPTNHLDFATMEWLENYLKGSPPVRGAGWSATTAISSIMSVPRSWEVSFQTMTTYKGNFSAYLPQKEARRCPAPEAARCRRGTG
ncbi:MAG: hypothetical protein ACLT9S_03325 [Faecalibacterium sp.]